MDLLVTSSYTFDARTTDYPSRFRLLFTKGNNSDDNFAIFHNGQWMSLGAFAQGGLFQYGSVSDEEYYGAGYREGDGLSLMLPSAHGVNTDQTAPLGSGTLLLAGLGAAYLFREARRKK